MINFRDLTIGDHTYSMAISNAHGRVTLHVGRRSSDTCDVELATVGLTGRAKDIIASMFFARRLADRESA